MDYTNNYHLPQWVKSDRIMMDDFNGAMGRIDTGVANAQSTANTAQSTANSAKSIANTAKSTADAAKSAAAAAQSTANAAKSAASTAQSAADAAQSTADAARQEAAVLPYAVGTYTGNNTQRTISVGFKPSFLIVSGMASTESSTTYIGERYIAATGGRVLKERCQFTASGFTLFPGDAAHKRFPDLNESGRVYDYIAFR